MAITGVHEMFTDTGGQDADGYNFEINWLVITDSHASGTFEVLNAPGIPVVGEKHRSGKAAAKTKRATKHESSDLLWVVTVSYEALPTDQQSSGGNGSGDNSTTQIPTIRLDDERSIKVSEFDHNGFLIANSAGDKYQDADEYEDADTIMTISASIPFEKITLDLIKQWRGTVHGPQFFPKFMGTLADAMATGANFPKFFGQSAFTPKFLGFGAATVQEPIVGGNGGSITRWQVNLRFAIAETWLFSRLDEGFYTNPGGGGAQSQNQDPTATTRKRILDPVGLPSIVPVKLNGKGDKSTGPVFYRFYQRFPHGDLNTLMKALGLSTNLADYKVTTK